MDARDKEVLDRINRLSTLVANHPAQADCLAEKGIECYIIAPAIDAWLHSDLLNNVSYEVTSVRRNDQRFDFVVDNEGVIEAKSLRNPISQYEEQILGYLLENPEYRFGILTNGLDWQIWLNCSEFCSDPDCEITRPIKVASMDFREQDKQENLIKTLCKLRPDTRNSFLMNLRACVRRIIVRGMGPWPKVDHDRELNEFIKNIIRRQIEQRPTQYLQLIQRDEVRPGAVFIHREDFAEISITIKGNGTIALSLGGIKIYNAEKTMRLWPNITSIMEELKRTELVFTWNKEITQRFTGKKKPHAWEFTPRE